MGDGIVGTFIFVGVEPRTGKVMAISSMSDPPWALNGPTSIIPSMKDEQGRKFKKVCSIPCDIREELASGGGGGAERLGHLLRPENLQHEWVEITQDVKNADMHLFPHPWNFGGADTLPIILDPVSDLTHTFAELRNSGEDVDSLISDGYIRFDNEPLNLSLIHI